MPMISGLVVAVLFVSLCWAAGTIRRLRKELVRARWRLALIGRARTPLSAAERTRMVLRTVRAENYAGRLEEYAGLLIADDGFRASEKSQWAAVACAASAIEAIGDYRIDLTNLPARGAN